MLYSPQFTSLTAYLPTLNFQTPHSILHQQEPDYTHLRVFGCSYFLWQQPLTPHKFNPRAPQCIFIGYSPLHKGYQCFNPLTGKTIVSRHVVFDKTTFPYSTLLTPTNPQINSTTTIPPQLLLPISSTTAPIHLPKTIPSSHTPNPEPSSTISPPHSPSPLNTQPPSPAHIPTTHPMTTRLKSGITKPKPTFDLQRSVPPSPDPSTYSQAVKHPHWHKAMQEEFQVLQSQNTWALVPTPTTANVLGCRWTYKTKLHANGSIARHKARLVAQGFKQEYGVDYDETFSPVAKIATIRILLIITAHHHWEVLQFDISNTFLHGNLDDLIYMAQPPGFIDRHHPDYVCRLHKSLYELKQAPRLWYSTLSTYLHQQGFSSSTADPSLLIYHKSTTYIYLLLYVDDILITGNHSQHIATLISNLHHRFSMKALGPVSTFLGIQIIKTSYGYFLNQAAYINTILQTAQLQDSKPVPTPMPIKSFSSPATTEPFDQPTHYRHLVDSLQYLTITCPDIAFTVNHLCQHMHTPNHDYFQLLKSVLRHHST